MLHLSPESFWRATPHELAAGVEAVIEARGERRSAHAPRLDPADIAELRAMLKGGV